MGQRKTGQVEFIGSGYYSDIDVARWAYGNSGRSICAHCEAS